MIDRTQIAEETKILVSYGERFSNEPEEVQKKRISYANMINELVVKRNELKRWEASRNLQIAISSLEDSCMRCVKAIYIMHVT